MCCLLFVLSPKRFIGAFGDKIRSSLCLRTREIFRALPGVMFSLLRRTSLRGAPLRTELLLCRRKQKSSTADTVLQFSSINFYVFRRSVFFLTLIFISDLYKTVSVKIFGFLLRRITVDAAQFGHRYGFYRFRLKCCGRCRSIHPSLFWRSRTPDEKL